MKYYVQNGSKEAAEEIYEEIRSLGYSEGYDSAQADADPEGW